LLASQSQSVVSDSIYDMQLSYTFFTDFPNSGAGTTGTFLETAANPVLNSPYNSETVYGLIQKKFLKEINATIVVLTDEYGGSKGNMPALSLPTIKNRPGYALPAGKYKYKIFSFIVQIKNFNIVI
jgi:hypothetical protein